MKIPPGGGPVELVAWGLRNPYGLAFDPQDRLYVTENSFDVRGSRSVFGAGDQLWRIEPGAWYGWPDFHGGRPLSESDHFKAPGQPAPGFLLASVPTVPRAPDALLGVHACATGLDFSRSEGFGYVGDAFIALFGDMAPATGKVLGPVGYRVVRVEVQTGVVEDFALNRRGRVTGPASLVGGTGLERPVACRFSPEGDALYVVDFGVMTVTDKGPEPRPKTGVLWRITRP
jgi:glucose/arabinose dehydrogenase